MSLKGPDSCEICAQEIIPGTPQIRITSDAIVESQTNGNLSLTGNKVVVFAIFHVDCIDESLRGSNLEQEDFDAVPYIDEARCLRRVLLKTSGPKADRRLRVIVGGAA